MIVVVLGRASILIEGHIKSFFRIDLWWFLLWLRLASYIRVY